MKGYEFARLYISLDKYAVIWKKKGDKEWSMYLPDAGTEFAAGQVVKLLNKEAGIQETE